MEERYHKLGRLRSLGIVTDAASITKEIKTRDEAHPTQSADSGSGGGDATLTTTPARLPKESEHQVAVEQGNDTNIGKSHNHGDHATIRSIPTVTTHDDDEEHEDGHGVSCDGATLLTSSVSQQRRCSNVNPDTPVMLSDEIHSGEGTINDGTDFSPDKPGVRFSRLSRDRPQISAPISSTSSGTWQHRLSPNGNSDWSANSGSCNNCSKVRLSIGLHPNLMAQHPELIMDTVEPAATRWGEEESAALFAEFVTANRRNNSRSKAFGNPFLETWRILNPLITTAACKSGKEKLF